MKRRDFLKFLAAAPALLTLPTTSSGRARSLEPVRPLDVGVGEFGRGMADVMEPKQRELTALYKAYLESFYNRKFSDNEIAADLGVADFYESEFGSHTIVQGRFSPRR